MIRCEERSFYCCCKRGTKRDETESTQTNTGKLWSSESGREMSRNITDYAHVHIYALILCSHHIKLLTGAELFSSLGPEKQPRDAAWAAPSAVQVRASAQLEVTLCYLQPYCDAFFRATLTFPAAPPHADDSPSTRSFKAPMKRRARCCLLLHVYVFPDREQQRPVYCLLFVYLESHRRLRELKFDIIEFSTDVVFMPGWHLTSCESANRTASCMANWANEQLL